MQRTHRLALVILCLLLSGCGYVGDPLPPALNIPVRIETLRAVQRGDRLLITFTIPPLTTEGMAVRQPASVDLRVGSTPTPFNVEAWAAGARAIPASAGEAGSGVEVTGPASEWYGKEVTVAVRLRNQRGRYSEWSNLQAIAVRSPLAVPEVKAEPHPAGVRLSWPMASEVGSRVRIWRQGPKEIAPVLLDTVEGSEYIDQKVVLGQEYAYRVQVAAGAVESEFSETVKLTPRDLFAPSVPGGVTALASLMSIELGWVRSPEDDVQEYRVYRADGDGEFAFLAGGLTETAYSDRQVTTGRTYRYVVTAADRSGNESARSSVVATIAP